MRTDPQTSTGGSTLLQAEIGMLGSHAQYLRDIADRQYQYDMDVRNQIETLRGGWKSQAAAVYCDQAMPDWDTHATNIRNALYSIADAVEGANRAYGSAEEENLLQIKQAAQGF